MKTEKSIVLTKDHLTEVAQQEGASLAELKHELFDNETIMSEVTLKLDRARLILGDWLDDYGFNQEPNPRKAVEWGGTMRNEEGHDKEGEQSFKWFIEYNRIYKFIEIVMDYVHGSWKMLDDLLDKKMAEEQTA